MFRFSSESHDRRGSRPFPATRMFTLAQDQWPRAYPLFREWSDRQTGPALPSHTLYMGTKNDPRIICPERLDNRAVVSFDDGKSPHCSAALLYATLPQARAMPLADEGGATPQRMMALMVNRNQLSPIKTV